MEDDIDKAKYAEQAKKNVEDCNESKRIAEEERQTKMRSIAHRNEGHQDKEARRKHDEYIESLEFRTTTEQAIR